MSGHEAFLREAVRLAEANRDRGARPFGAVLVLGDQVVASGVNDVVGSHDPTTHAEMEAIRAASRALGRPDLTGSVVYASGHPCPMCLAALVTCGVSEVYYAFDNADAAPYGFSSGATYAALRLALTPPPLPMTKLAVGITAAELYGSKKA
jgi:tRNA(Arg) A34 adenosine deaminase TadA